MIRETEISISVNRDPLFFRFVNGVTLGDPQSNVDILKIYSDIEAQGITHREITTTSRYG